MIAQQETICFADDGETPNNPRLPLVLYRLALPLDGARDPAAEFEKAFSRHGWGDGWRNGIYGFLHFHSHTHEVLGIARGRVTVEFGGAKGKLVDLAAGDVAILPAGTGHRRISASSDLLVVGAYPEGGDGSYDQPASGRATRDAAIAAIASTPLPRQDPMFGRDGPLMTLWTG